MGLPTPSIIPMPPSSPAGGGGSGSGGSINIAVTFPDGQIAIVSANALIKPAFPSTSITIGSIVYVPNNDLEMAGIMAEITAAIQLGQSAVVLNSTAAFPTSISTASPATGAEFAATDIIVAMTAPAANAAPAAAFRTDGVFTLNGLACVTRFINVFTVIITSPPLSKTSGPANNGKVPLAYSDPRGSMQVADYYQYV